MNKIVSFGDSFIFGSELQNNDDGSNAWPGLIANRLGLDYVTCAEPGCGNENITQQIFNYFSEDKNLDCIAIINWTWMCRWDFFLNQPVEIPITTKNMFKYLSSKMYNTLAGNDWPPFENFTAENLSNNNQFKQEIINTIKNLKIVENGKWITLGPTCVPDKLSWLDRVEAQAIIDWYNDNLYNNLLWNKFKSLQTILCVQNFLTTKKIKNIQLYMDYELFDDTYKNLSPPFIIEMQKQLRNILTLFHDDKNFLDWARDSNFTITSSPGDHPLEDAHNAAADLYIHKLKNKIYGS